MEDTVYIGSLWHQDSDPFLSVIATDLNVAEAKLLELAEEEYYRVIDDFEEDEDIVICNSGVHPEPTKNLETFICFQHTIEEATVDLEDQGYFIC